MLSNFLLKAEKIENKLNELLKIWINLYDNWKRIEKLNYLFV